MQAYFSVTNVTNWHEVGNCDIDFFIFHRLFCIIRLKILKFKRGLNDIEKIWSGNNKIAQNFKNVIKKDEIIV